MSNQRVVIKHRTATSAEFQESNIILGLGEPSYERDTHKQKIGDGVTPYRDLSYSAQEVPDTITLEDLEDHVNSDTPHPVYDDGPSFTLLYENAKV